MKCKLTEICDYVKGKIAVSELTKENYVSTENMLPNRCGITTATNLPTTTHTQEYRRNDVLVSNIRPYFKKIWYATANGGCSNDVLVFRAKDNVEPEYLYYVLSDDKFFDYSNATSKGTKMPRGDKVAIMKFEIEKHNTESQKKIAAVLGKLDKKIENNIAVNDNLQKQVEAVFKALVVERRSKNKKYISLERLCSVVTKGTTPTTIGKSFSDKGIGYIKAETILDNHTIDQSKFSYIDEETHCLLKRSVIYENDIVFTIAGTLGRFALIDKEIVPANINQAVAIIRARDGISPYYLYSCFLGGWHSEFYSKRMQQAVQANLSLTTIKALPIPILEGIDMENYLSLIEPLIRKIKNNEIENRRLASLRDTLLPKLMSGEIDASRVEI